jgi:hypothetical protein
MHLRSKSLIGAVIALAWAALRLRLPVEMSRNPKNARYSASYVQNPTWSHP